jgi:hypothetical protein
MMEVSVAVFLTVREFPVAGVSAVKVVPGAVSNAVITSIAGIVIPSFRVKVVFI